MRVIAVHPAEVKPVSRRAAAGCHGAAVPVRPHGYTLVNAAYTSSLRALLQGIDTGRCVWGACGWHDRGIMDLTTAFDGKGGDAKGNAWTVVVRLGDADGSSAHPHLRRLLAAVATPLPVPLQRTLSDAVHAICDVHGRFPGMIEDALAHARQPEALPWIEIAARSFAAERTFLAQLTAAVGPVPSTPGQAETEAALAGLRHALGMLGGSGRAGCASGAIAALLYDWVAVRGVLDVAASRLEVDAPALSIPTPDDCAAIVPRLGTGAGRERAIAFGAQQFYAQHRGLWSLLEARASARGDI